LKMETTLRPMSLGEILDRTAELYRTHFLLFAGISGVYAGVLLVMSLIQIGITQLLTAMHMHAGQQLWVTLGFLGLIFPVSVIAGGVAIATNNRAVAWVNLGQAATIRGAYKSILPRMWTYVWLAFLIIVIIWTPFVLLYGGYAFFLFTLGAFHPASAQHPSTQSFMLIGVVSLLFVILIVAAVVYAILMGLRYSLAVPACVVENLNARKAMRRSIELSKGSRGRIFLLALLILTIEFGLVLISQGAFFFVAFKSHMVLPVWAQILQQVVGFFTNTFIGPMYATGLTLFYYDQRIRKEGYDIEWMMEAAGLSWPPPWSGIDAGTARSAPGALAIDSLSVAIEPGAPAESAGSLRAESGEAESEGVSTAEPAAQAPGGPTPTEITPPENTSPGIDHEQH
jgi:hypothetical protein